MRTSFIHSWLAIALLLAWRFPAAAQPVPAVPLSLDTVFRLAKDHNGQLKIARERLNEAYARQDLADKRWLPDLTVGPSYYRHEGGIQDFQGNLLRSSYGSAFVGVELRGKLDFKDWVYQKVEAQRNILQRQGEISQLAGEQLVDAASTYLDLLAVRTAQMLARESEKKIADLLEQTQNIARIDSGLRVEVIRVEADLGGQRILAVKIEEAARKAELKILYLLGLPLQQQILLLDSQMAQFVLVSGERSAMELVEQAMRGGPGVPELSALVAKIWECQKSAGAEILLPTLEMTAGEGLFGAGPGSNFASAQRFDLGIGARWNLTNWHLSKENDRLRSSQLQQASLSLNELKAKLTLGVQEALESIKSSQEQIAFALVNMDKAKQNFELSRARFTQNIKGASASEVLLAIRASNAAQISYMHAIRDFNKAQVRLFTLVGGSRE